MGNVETMMQQRPDTGRYWRRTSRLMWTTLAAWAFFGFGVHAFVQLLNAVEIAGFPLGYYMAAQGSLIAFVIMLFLFSRRQDKIDRSEGVAEEHSAPREG